MTKSTLSSFVVLAQGRGLSEEAALAVAKIQYAAPDLLIALKRSTDEFQEWLDWAEANRHVTKTEAKHQKRLIEGFRAAIAKATA